MSSARFLNKKSLIVAIVATGAISAILIFAAFPSAPANAFFGGPRFGMHESGSGTEPSGLYYGSSDANWTGSVSVQSVRSDVIDVLRSKVNASVSDADSAATQALGEGSKVCCVTLAPVNGYLVYVVHGVDSSNNPYRIVIDAGNGNVLVKEQAEMGMHAPWKTDGQSDAMWRK